MPDAVDDNIFVKETADGEGTVTGNVMDNDIQGADGALVTSITAPDGSTHSVSDSRNGTTVEGGAATPGRCTSTGGNDSDARNVTAEKGTAVVGTYPPNDWGIYDMHGNIQEFCLDYYMDDPTPLRGAVNTTVNTGGHIVRGGCFVQSWGCIRSAWRSYNKDNYQPKHFGVRLVCGIAK